MIDVLSKDAESSRDGNMASKTSPHSNLRLLGIISLAIISLIVVAVGL
jgi:hypothetical protein